MKKTKHYLLFRKWLVPKTLIKKVGMKATVIDEPNAEKSPKIKLKDLMESMNHGFATVNQWLVVFEKDVKLIKSFRTIQKEDKRIRKEVRHNLLQ